MCSIEPSVNNAKATFVDGNNSATVTYECLPGFAMSGTARITCDKTVKTPTWPTPPSCNVITQNTYVYNTVPENYEDWWYYLLAALLGLLVLAVVAALIWCCCCTPTWCRMASVYPFHQNQQSKSWHRRRCCCCQRQRSVMRLNTDERIQKNGHGDSVFWIDSPQKNDWKGSPDRGQALSQCSSVLAHIGNENRGLSGKQATRSFHVPLADHLKKGVTEVNSKHNMPSVETPQPRESQLYRNTRPAKDPSKETKLWMPHSHNIRNINTSTK